ncbi:MAG: glycosyltransferase [Elusimicrobiota bacterium]|nr:glycosyltransferase [Elusimicrobiota bacterium]
MPAPLRLACVSHLSQLFGAGLSMLESLARLDPAVVSARLVTLEPGPLEDAARAKGLAVDRLEWLAGLGRPWRAVAAVPRLAAWLRRERVDILELNRVKYDLLAASWAACRLAGVKLVQRERMHAKGVPTGLRRWLLARPDRLLSVSSGAVAPWYEGAPDWWRASLDRRMVILPSARDTAALKALPRERAAVAALGVPGDAEVVGFLAALDPRKRPDLFLRMAALVAARRPKAWFVLVGGPYGARRDGPDAYEQGLRLLAAELGLSGRVVFTGYRADAYRLLQNFSVLVLPSEREALGGVLIEAMAAGVPQVAAAVDGIPEVVADGETGLLVRSSLPDDYAAAVLKLLEDPALAGRMREASLSRAELFGVDAIARRTEAVYRSL